MAPRKAAAEPLQADRHRGSVLSAWPAPRALDSDPADRAAATPPTAQPAAASSFAGVLEAPTHGAQAIGSGRLALRGWALCDPPVDCIEARCGSAPPVRLQHGLPRPDVAEAYATSPANSRNSHASGFAGLLALDGLAPGDHVLEVQVQAAGQQVHRWRRTIHLADPVLAYGAWRQQLLARALAASPEPAGSDAADTAIATWLIERDGNSSDADLAATLDSLSDGDGSGDGDSQNQSHGAGAAPRYGRFNTIVLQPGQPLPPITTRFAGRLRAGDRLAAGAAGLLATLLRAQPALDLVYADHDHLQADGRWADPVLKPGWSALLAEHPDVARGPWLLSQRALAATAVRWGGQRWPALAEAAAQCRQVAQIPLPLLSVATSDAGIPIDQKERPALPAANTAKVSVIVPTCLADPAMLARCLEGLRERTRGGAELELVVVLNNLDAAGRAQARALLARWSPVVIEQEGPFNWSAFNNAGARVARGDWLLFLNDDVEPLVPGWLDAMLALAARPGVGAVGAVLRYPDGSLQHAGVTLHANPQPQARHRFRGCSGTEPRVARWLRHDRIESAVTGACLLSARTVFDRQGGFDVTLPVVCNDVDYCLRLRQAGLASGVAAGALLLHHEGRSRRGIAESADQQRFEARWLHRLPAVDPFSHPALAEGGEDWQPAFDRLPAYEPRMQMSVDATDPPPHAAPHGPRHDTPHATDHHWQQWGERDPYYAVITNEMFRRDRLDPAALRLFFKSGRAHAKHVLAICRRHFDRDFKPARILDFGCGVGRLLVGFSEWAEEIVGVDISEAMLAEARKNCDGRGLKNIVLLRSDDQLSQVQGQFDLVHSTIVLQHIDPSRGCELFARLVERVKPGGMGSLHLTYAKSYWPERNGQAPAIAIPGWMSRVAAAVVPPLAAAASALPQAPLMPVAPVERAAPPRLNGAHANGGMPVSAPVTQPAPTSRWRWPLWPKKAAAAQAVAQQASPAAAGSAALAQAPAPAPVAMSAPAWPAQPPHTAHTLPPGADPEIQMNIYPLNEVFYLAQTAGIRELHVEFSDHGGELGVVLFFRRPPARMAPATPMAPDPDPSAPAPGAAG